MVERLDDMPQGTVGFRASGEVTRVDYLQVLEPALREAVESGEVRMLYIVESGFEMDGGAILQDAKTASPWGWGTSHRGRTAVVTDVEWVSRAVRMFAWLAPGEVRVWPMGGLDEAREWVAG